MVLDKSLNPIETILSLNFGYDIYNPFNHLIYAMNRDYGTVTIIAPNNTIVKNVTVEPDSSGMAVDPSNGSVYVSGAFEVIIINNTLATSSVHMKYELGGNMGSVVFDEASGVALLGFSGGYMVAANGTSVLGYIPVGLYPNGAAYDPFNHDVYVSSFESGAITILNLNVSKVSQVSIPWTSIYALSALIAIDSISYVLLRSTGKNA